MSHRFNLAVHGLDIDHYLSPPNEKNKLLKDHPAAEDPRAFRCRSQSIKLRNPNRRRRRHHHGRTRRSSSLAQPSRPSLYSMEEKTKEILDDLDNTDCDSDASYYARRRERRQALLKALASVDAKEEKQEASKKLKLQERSKMCEKNPSVRTKSNQVTVRRSRSMDPGLLRVGRGVQDQGEEQPDSPDNTTWDLRRSKSLDGKKKSATARGKKRKKKKKKVVPKKISSISSVDTTMMERDIWIECLWFKKTTKRKTYWKSFRTQKCFKRPPEGARTVLYLEHFFDADEDYLSPSTSCSSTNDDYSDCGDSMECLYHEKEFTAMGQQKGCGVPSEMVSVSKQRKKRSTTKTSRRLRKRWKALIRLVKFKKASF